MAADAIALADSIAAQLVLTFAGAGFPLANITREYEIVFDLGTFTGMQVPIFPVKYEDTSKSTRIESENDVMGCIVITERWTPAGKPTKQWIDDRVNLVQEAIFEPLNKIEIPLLIVQGSEYWPIEVKVTSVYDIVYMRKHKVFWSEVEYTFRKLRIR